MQHVAGGGSSAVWELKDQAHSRWVGLWTGTVGHAGVFAEYRSDTGAARFIAAPQRLMTHHPTSILMTPRCRLTLMIRCFIESNSGRGLGRPWMTSFGEVLSLLKIVIVPTPRTRSRKP